MKPIRLDEKEIREYTERGHWDKTILPDYWEWNARRWPDRECLVDPEGTRLTWSQAVRKIDRIALAIVNELRLKRDDRLMIQLPNIAEHVLIRLACEKAGILSIPEMPAFRHSELKWIGQQTHVAGMVIPDTYRDFDYVNMAKEIQSELSSLKYIIVAGSEVPAGCVSLKRIMEKDWENECSMYQLEKIRFDPVNEVGFLSTTTGTTGVPKIIEHRIAAREIWSAKAHIKNWELDHNDIMLAFAPLAGAAGGTPAYVTAPVAGAKIILEYEFRVEEVLKRVDQERATIIALVPAQLSRLLQLDLAKYDLSSLRFLKTAGGYLPPALAQEAEEKFGCPILGTFGSQDTGSISGVPISSTKEQRYTTVGRLHSGVEIKVLDEQGKKVTEGKVGTIYFKGPGNSIGYYRDLDKTMSEAFDKDGWSTTGDLVTFSSDGWLKIMGREKDIIIRGGQNIYPKEIEDYLIAHPNIAEAAVVPMPDMVMGEKACAFVTLIKEKKFTFQEMIEYLKSKKIAVFKLPERLEIIDAMPLAASTKIDKKTLKQLIEKKLGSSG
ncbi:AMP-binding protein [Thermodesulfobacteriota bacterium]